MSNTKIRILWVDDDTSKREKEARLLEGLFFEEYGKNNLIIEVIHPNRLTKRLEYKTKKPDLFLVDYNLNQIPFDGGESFPYKGLTAGGIIREYFPECPIFITSQDERASIFTTKSQAAKSSFEDLISYKDLQRSGHKLLYFYARDYKKIREAKDDNIEEIYKLLGVPEGLKEKIKLVLPDELKNGFDKNHAGNSIAFAKWVRNVFLVNPGFVYDTLYAATHVGLNVDTYLEIAEKNKRFKKIRYNGIFSEVYGPLWWVSEINNMIFSYQKASKLETTNTWELGPIIFNVSENECPKCAVCGKDCPDTVGINIHDENEQKPIHYRCSVPYINKKRELYFDEYRGFERKSQE